MNIFIPALLFLFPTDRCLHNSHHAMGDRQLHSPYSHTEQTPVWYSLFHTNTSRWARNL